MPSTAFPSRLTAKRTSFSIPSGWAEVNWYRLRRKARSSSPSSQPSDSGGSVMVCASRSVTVAYLVPLIQSSTISGSSSSLPGSTVGSLGS